jgi:hypothetical protein
MLLFKEVEGQIEFRQLIQPSMLAVENKELVEIATEIKNRLKK